VKLEMLPVAGGSLELGATAEQLRYAEDDENPVRTVSLPSFKMSKTEVTLALWQAVMETTPFGNDPSYPGRAVINVSWYDAEAFVVRLRELTGRPFRLPSEDEWEYAARGGQKSGGYVFAGGNNAKDYVVCTGKAAWGKNKGENVRPQLVNVASKKPNELGLYDMSGNAWEWVRGASPGGLAILRGGSRLSTNIACRVSNRQAMDPLEKKDTFGFRIAL